MHFLVTQIPLNHREMGSADDVLPWGSSHLSTVAAFLLLYNTFIYLLTNLPIAVIVVYKQVVMDFVQMNVFV